MTITPAIRARIDATLADLESRENIHILWAVESGSRAWGFPSPDSDYDVRFVYVRPLEWYLSLNPGRDVVELPIADELDVAGWDLHKALGLLVKANPALLEWLSSPIVYRATPEAESLRALARRSPYRRSAAHHYLALLRGNYDRYIADRPMVRLKKYMYCLRPALALLWLRSRDDMVPMDQPSLLAGLSLPADLDGAIGALVAKKSASGEMGEGPRVAVIDAFLEQELRLAQEGAIQTPSASPEFHEAAEVLFRALVLGISRAR
ncbi:MAG: nucleotidyltransferase domain-containing protein [Magnetospirillum sp.]|nr:nucleotidyltransferase domain-containing protein [Magnetospirillum sp.]